MDDSSSLYLSNNYKGKMLRDRSNYIFMTIIIFYYVLLPINKNFVTENQGINLIYM